MRFPFTERSVCQVNQSELYQVSADVQKFRCAPRLVIMSDSTGVTDEQAISTSISIQVVNMTHKTPIDNKVILRRAETQWRGIRVEYNW